MQIKIVQISAVYDPVVEKVSVYGIDDKGNVWVHTAGAAHGWYLINMTKETK